MSENRFEDLRDDYLQRCYFRMKQIEREWKAAQDDATDDEVGSVGALLLTDLMISRTMCYRQPTLTIQLKVLITGLAPSLLHVVGRMSRLIGNSKTMLDESCSTKSAPPLSPRMRTQTTRLRVSLAALLDSRALIEPKPLRITTLAVLRMLRKMLKGHRHHNFDCLKSRSFPTIKQPCSCSLRISQQRSLLLVTTPTCRTKVARKRFSSCRRQRLLLSSTSIGHHHQCPLLPIHLWLCLHKRPTVVQSWHHSHV